MTGKKEKGKKCTEPDVHYVNLPKRKLTSEKTGEIAKSKVSAN
jgi:hypothetical protein